MIALFWLFLALSVSPFKSKNGLAGGAPTSIDCAAAEGAQSHSTHEWGSLVLGHAVSMVSLGPQGHHDRPSRDSRTLASSRLPSVLAVEIPLSWRPTEGCFRSRWLGATSGSIGRLRCLLRSNQAVRYLHSTYVYSR